MVFAAALALPLTAAHPKEHLHATTQDSEAAASLVPTPTADAEPTDRSATLEAIDSEAQALRTLTPIDGGVASYYGKRFHGRPTASGERFDMHAYTAAHRTLPFGSLVEVTNPRTGRSITVRINDRGPFHGRRVIDLSRAAAEELDLISRGSGRVELALVDEI